MHATPNNAAVSTVAIDLAKDVFELAFADPQARIVERARLPRSAFARVLDNRAPARGDGGVRVGALLGTALPGYDRRGGVRHAFDPRASAGVRRGRPAQPALAARRRHRPDHRDRAEHLGRRVRPLPLWPPLRQFARADAARHSSGHVRRLGRVTKRGDVYLRMLLIHAACVVLRSAKVAAKKQQPLDRTRAWALALCARVGHNKATVALANKTARRLWAAEHHRASFDPDHVSVQPTPASTN